MTCLRHTRLGRADRTTTNPYTKEDLIDLGHPTIHRIVDVSREENLLLKRSRKLHESLPGVVVKPDPNNDVCMPRGAWNVPKTVATAVREREQREWAMEEAPRIVVRAFETASAAQRAQDAIVAQLEACGFGTCVADETLDEAQLSSGDSNPRLERVPFQQLDTDEVEQYVRWLESQGHPRGRLGRLQLQRYSNPDDETLGREQAATLRRYPELDFGPDARFPPESIKLDWAAGFIRGATLTIDDDKIGSIAHAVSRLLSHPSARHLRSLSIAGKHSYTNSLQELIDIVAFEGPPTLKSIVLARMESEQAITRPDDSELGDVGCICAMHPQLERVVFIGDDIRIGKCDLAAMRELHVLTRGLRAEDVSSLLNTEWPKLEAFTVWLDRPYECFDDYYHLELWNSIYYERTQATVDRLRPIWEAQGFPSLRHLGLVGSSHADALMRELVSSPLARNLESLDLSFGHLTDEGARTLREHAVAFQSLRRLNLSHQLDARKSSPDSVALDLGGLGKRSSFDRLPEAFCHVDDSWPCFAPRSEGKPSS